MAAIYNAEIQFHSGEQEMHKLFKIPNRDNPTAPLLTPYAANLLVQSPIIALGTLDGEGKPWTTILGGESGFSQPVAQSIIGLNTTVERVHDPVISAIFGDKVNGEIIKETETGRMISALAIDLEHRKRVKLYGHMVAGALSATEDGIGNVQLVVKIEQSLGNCPKYLNKKRIRPCVPRPTLVTTELPLPKEATELLTKADLFFISSSNHESDMDTNIRGGPPGFLRILENDEQGLALVWPEYSGNRLYQTLGNLRETPQAGLTIPDFDTGDVIYVTGTTQILVGKSASGLIAHTNLAVKLQVKALRFVSSGLAFRGEAGEPSPYNPPVRYLSIEDSRTLGEGQNTQAALISKDILSPTIARLRFRVSDPAKSTWKSGQYVALSFQDELDMGYSHMRDNAPRSLNDDFLRTFTVSSRDDGSGEFDITIRNVGVVTDFLFKQNVRSGLEVSLQGFGGDFYIEQNDERIAFVAGGVGVTPLLAQAQDLNLRLLTFYWTVKADDLGFVKDTFDRNSELARSAKLYVTGAINHQRELWRELESSGAILENRRLVASDLSRDEALKWYLCTSPALRTVLLGWLTGKQSFYEDFNY
ncbi:oxidoreductase-like protein [Bisporella sp. PMI_857]|nr:oxidoreductase-like protein [Bisporella sp. PMI_857]